MIKEGWDYITFSRLMEEKFPHLVSSNALASSAECIYDSIFVEYSRVCGTDP